MKKFFTLIAATAMALTATAQKISWTEDDLASAGTLDGKTFGDNGFVLTITDTDGKFAIDKNSAWFGTADSQAKSDGGRLKSGGKSSSKNQLNLTIPGAGTLKVYARTGSNSATDRPLVIMQGEAELYNQVVQEADAIKVKGLDSSDPEKETNVYPIISVEVSAGEVNITYPVGSMNFYGFEFVAGGSGSTDTWTVAGSSTILGSTWNPGDTSNDMTTTDGVNYTLVKENCTLEKGSTYEYKVVKNHAWGEEYPSSNATLTVDETAIFKVTFSFNSETKEVSATAVKTGEAGVIEHTYDVKGDFFGDEAWSNTYPMTKGNDGLWTVVIENLDAGNYEFKVREDNSWDISYPGSNYQVTVEANGSSLTIVFNPETKTIEATVSDVTGINTIKTAQQTAVVYNLAGQKVSENYKGVVIMNGRKMIQK